MTKANEPNAQQARLMKRWFTVVVIGAVSVIGFGVWEVLEGRTGAGIGYIAIAVATTLLVLTIKKHARSRS